MRARGAGILVRGGRNVVVADNEITGHNEAEPTPWRVPEEKRRIDLGHAIILSDTVDSELRNNRVAGPGQYAKGKIIHNGAK